VEFANIIDGEVKRIGKVSMTPEVCRTGCKHYDGLEDVNDGQFKEYCWERGTKEIIKGQYCACFESKKPKLTEGILTV
jgi:cobalamin synthase